MRFLETLQHKIGFTRTEAFAVITLSATFMVGLGIRWLQLSYQEKADAPQFDYSKSDSAYTARLSASKPKPPIQQNVAHPPTPQATEVHNKSKKIASPLTSININTATKTQLMQLPGIGEAYAQRIVEYRQNNKRFASIDELANIKGIGKKKLEKLRPFVSIQ